MRSFLTVLLLVARLVQAQRYEAVQVVGIGGRVNVVVMKDSAFLSMLIPDGSTFAFRTDSVTMATLADNADLETDSTHGARIAYTDPTLHRGEALTFVRLSTDSNSGYRLIAEDGARTASLVLPADSARVVFGAMRGEQQTTMTAHMMTGPMRAMNAMNFQVRIPPRERPGAPPLGESGNSWRTHGQGEVILSFLVDTTGHVDRTSIQAVGSPDPVLTGAAVDNILRTSFDPAELNGQRFAQRIQKKFVFKLNSR